MQFSYVRSEAFNLVSICRIVCSVARPLSKCMNVCSVELLQSEIPVYCHYLRHPLGFEWGEEFVFIIKSLIRPAFNIHFSSMVTMLRKNSTNLNGPIWGH